MSQLEGGGTAPPDNERLRSLDTRVFMDTGTRISRYYMLDIYLILHRYLCKYLLYIRDTFYLDNKVNVTRSIIILILNYQLFTYAEFSDRSTPTFSVSDGI